jgi:hypothetical protein
MKTILFALVTFAGLSAGAQTLQTSSAGVATNAFTFTPIPLTNQAPFTNTVVAPTNPAAFQLSNVVTLLLMLQTNIEQTLPVLDFIQSNAVVVSATPTNINHGFATPMTSIPDPLGVGLTPTGASSGTDAPQATVTSLSVQIGTNNFDVDAATLQAIFVLRNDLQHALPSLQGLNGTSPTPTNSPAPTVLNPGVTNFSPGPLTNPLTAPQSNMAPF